MWCSPSYDGFPLRNNSTAIDGDTIFMAYLTCCGYQRWKLLLLITCVFTFKRVLEAGRGVENNDIRSGFHLGGGFVWQPEPGRDRLKDIIRRFNTYRRTCGISSI